MKIKKVLISGLLLGLMLNLAGCVGSPGKSQKKSSSVKTEKKVKQSSKQIKDKSNEVVVKVKR